MWQSAASCSTEPGAGEDKCKLLANVLIVLVQQLHSIALCIPLQPLITSLSKVYLEGPSLSIVIQPVG